MQWTPRSVEPHLWAAAHAAAARVLEQGPDRAGEGDRRPARRATRSWLMLLGRAVEVLRTKDGQTIVHIDQLELVRR